MEQKFNIGEKIALVNDDVRGVVKAIEHGMVVINTQDGFDMKVFPAEIVSQEKAVSGLKEFIPDKELGFLAGDKGALAKQAKHSHRSKKTHIPLIEVDLHIEKIVSPSKGRPSGELLEIQLRHARAAVDNALRNRTPRLVFIHGVGDGILRDELHHLLRGYARVQFFDAPYYKYGIGATEVEISPS